MKCIKLYDTNLIATVITKTLKKNTVMIFNQCWGKCVQVVQEAYSCIRI